MKTSLQIILLATAFLLFISEANSQTIAVKNFRKLETDQDARISSPKTDQNGKKCAIIKVVTSQSGFVFDFGLIGNAVATEQKTAEIWVWVPAGARKVTISHQQLGILRNYPFQIDIEEATDYEMVLVTGKITTLVEEQIVSQWLVINPDPTDAMVYINDQFTKNGTYQAKLKMGSYTYRVEAPLHHTEAGKLEISDKKLELNVKLKPAFGYLSVNSEPEQDAKVIIDGKLQTKTTPFQSEALASGEHTVQVVKEMYQPSAQKVIVTDGQTTPANFILRHNFADVSITTPADAMLYINNLQKGTGSWQGRLNPGVYSLEARQEKHQSAKQDIDVVAGDKRMIDLQPIPMSGSLDVMTTPAGITITIEGKDYGTSPNTINKLLIGDYLLKLSKVGYVPVNKIITITEGKSTEIIETLISEKPLNVKSNAEAKEVQKKAPDKSIRKPIEKPIGKPAFSAVYYKYKQSKTIWLGAALASSAVATYSFLQSNKYFTQYQQATTDASGLQQKVKLYDQISPVAFGVAGFCTLEFIFKAAKQSKAKKQTLSFYPQPVNQGIGLGMVCNF